MTQFQKGHKINKGRIPWNKIQRPEIPEFPIPTKEEVLWAAGFYEGEGSVATRSAIVSQVNKWPLERLLLTFGGHIGQRPSSRSRPNSQPIWQWHICGEQGRLFIELIYPHLSPRRREQIDKIFITEEKRKRIRSSVRKTMALVSSFRERSPDGRYNNAKISRGKIEEKVWEEQQNSL